MAKTAAHRQSIANFIGTLGVKITLHSADPGTSGASLIPTTPASGNTTWGGATDNGTESTIVGSGVVLSVPASTNVTHYGIWNGATFLRGDALGGSIMVNSNGPVSVEVTPKSTFK